MPPQDPGHYMDGQNIEPRCPSRANLPGVETLITKAQLRWSGHAMRMEDSVYLNKSSVPNWPLANAIKGTSENVTARTA